MHLGIIKITYNRTAQPRCYHNTFYGRQFREPRRGDNSDFAMTIWRLWISNCMFCYQLKYLLLTAQMQSFACCVCERVSERVTSQHRVCVCVCSRVWEGDTVTQLRLVYCKYIRYIHTNTYIITVSVSVTWLCFPFWLELMVKLRTLLTLHLFWKLKLTIMERGVTFPTHACGVGPLTMHCASWPIRADCACRKEGLCRKRSVWERRGIEDLQ